MAAYYVFGILLVVWALALAAMGLTRPDFPPSGVAGRALVGLTVLIVAGTLIALLASTHVEHPREEAAAKAAELKQGAGGEKTTAPAAGGKTVKVTEKEFKIALASGDKLAAGKYSFQVANVGKIQHDLTIEGGKLKELKTPLIDAGKTTTLQADLQPGKYTFYCSVPGHEQLGMKVNVTVAGAAQGGNASKPPAKAKRAKPKPKAKPKAQKTNALSVTEQEFSIKLAGGSTLKAGKYRFGVTNTGQIQHDLAIKAPGFKAVKTKLIDGGKSGDLVATLKPGKYTFYCTVPGHEQAGMKVNVTVQ